MPGGFFRGLVATAIDSYNQAKADVSTSESSYGQYAPDNGQYYDQYSSQNNAQYRYGGSNDYGSQPSPAPYNPSYEIQYDNVQSNPRQSYPYSPPQPPPYTPVAAPAPRQEPNPQTTSDWYFQPHTPGGCNPLVNLPQSFYTSSVPTFAVCTQCYHQQISHTCYAPLFKLEQHPPNRNIEVNCDMSVATIGTAWKTACSRAMATSSTQEQQLWLSQFAQQFQDVQTQLLTIIPQIRSLVQQIRVADLQAEYTKASALMQVKMGSAMMSWGNGGGLSSQLALQRLGDAGQMNMDNNLRRMQLRNLLAQLQNIYGPEFHINV